MMENITEKKEYGKIMLRIVMSLVFLWFGINQLMNSSSWTGFIPHFLTSITSAKTFVIFNGILEIVLGLTLFFGFFVRISSFILSAHLIAISLSLGYGPTMIRDFGLALATFAVFLNGKDGWCYGHRI